MKRRRDIQQREIRIQLRIQPEPLLHILIAIAQLQVALHPVEQRRSNRQKAVLGVSVRHRANVAVHSEDLLHHNQRANRRLRGGRHIGAQLVSIVCFQLYSITHAFTPMNLQLMCCVYLRMRPDDPSWLVRARVRPHLRKPAQEPQNLPALRLSGTARSRAPQTSSACLPVKVSSLHFRYSLRHGLSRCPRVAVQRNLKPAVIRTPALDYRTVARIPVAGANHPPSAPIPSTLIQASFRFGRVRMSRAQYVVGYGRRTAVSLAVGIMAAASSLAAQDARTVKQPVHSPRMRVTLRKAVFHHCIRTAN